MCENSLAEKSLSSSGVVLNFNDEHFKNQLARTTYAGILERALGTGLVNLSCAVVCKPEKKFLVTVSS